MDTDRYNWISRRAHQIWQQEGFPSGRDREHWSQAVAERNLLELGECFGSDRRSVGRGQERVSRQ
ncbi:DUF2934 domain-containing protein (plasmid) [Rhizobium sp. CB3090]|uniref:DUF2934 domain-containing protein n=1 Tax=Rhizobium sp. CB3090 TaxID=3039156 RepID=UPI0024B08EDA|nr:DUF2934 domain-containing protein [Rhizobium sp. CB3090]WFU11606.1 DUF2934 domain-containing protein [Rhizobium sp. CB3090]